MRLLLSIVCAAIFAIGCDKPAADPPTKHFGAVVQGQSSNGAIASLPLTNDGLALVVSGAYSYANQTSAATVIVKSTAGILHTVCVDTLVGSATVKLYDDNLTPDAGVVTGPDGGAATSLGVITMPSTITGVTPFCQQYDLKFATGLVVVTSGNTDVTEAFQ